MSYVWTSSSPMPMAANPEASVGPQCHALAAGGERSTTAARTRPQPWMIRSSSAGDSSSDTVSANLRYASSVWPASWAAY